MRLIIGLLLAGISAPAAAGTLFTTNVGYTGPVLDLTAYRNGGYTVGPLVIGDFTFTAAPISGNLPDISQGDGYALGDNGPIELPAYWIGLNAPQGYMDFALASPVSELGFFTAYAIDSGQVMDAPTISSLDVNGNVIESFDLSALAPITSAYEDANHFEFRGIRESAASIYGLRMGGSYIIVGHVETPPPGVPEPAAWLTMIAGFGVIGAAVRRKGAGARIAGLD